jgi:branched-chain amino acid transport system substrate-binding protein
MAIRRRLMAMLVVGLIATACAGGEADDPIAPETTGGASDTTAGSDDTTAPDDTGSSDDPIVIGTSLPLTGDFSEPGEGTSLGQELWVEMVNENGGLLGRPIELIVRDDGSDPDTVVSDYEQLITVEEVDLILGTFSSRLVIPSSEVAERYDMLYVQGGGGSPEVFSRGLWNIVHAAPATADRSFDALGEWILALPDDERPQSAAYASLDDPFALAGAEGLRAILEEGGIETVVNEVYPPEQTDFLATAAQIADSGAEIVIGGTQFEDSVQIVRGLQELGYQPDIVAMSTGPTLLEFEEAVGGSIEGIMAPVGYSKDAGWPTNAEFTEAFEEANGFEATEDPAQGYTAGQILGAAVEGAGCADSSAECQMAMRDWLADNTVDTVQGPLSWNEDGTANGSYVILQWQDGNIEIVLPEGESSTSDIIYPKPEW